MSSQLTLEAAFNCQLSALEKRCGEKREYHGLLVWTPIFRGILGRLRKRDQLVQMELMQLEHEVRTDGAKALARIEKIKGLLACVCLGLLSLGALDFDNDQFVRRARGGARRGREELVVV